MLVMVGMVVIRAMNCCINIVAENVNEFAEKNRMRLNPRKCKEMVIDPLEYNTTVLRPITIGNTTIEKVKKYKLLGVILTVDLKWKEHIAYIYGEACKRLYISLTRTTQSWCRNKKYVKGLLGNHKTNTRIRRTGLAGHTGTYRRALKIIKPGEESYEELLTVFNVEKL